MLAGQAGGRAGARVDEIAEHVVMADAQVFDPRTRPVAAVQIGDQPPAFIAKRAGFIERGIEPGRDQPAVPGEQR